MIQIILKIALNTYRESVRGKVLYSLVFFAVAIVSLSALFGAVTIGDQLRIIKDLGLMSISLFAVALAVISGASLLHKELHRKTIHNILAKPVHRWQFLVGKHLGLLMTEAVMIALMAMGLVIFCYFFEPRIDYLIFQASLFIFFELIIVTSIAIFFSSILVTPALSGLFTFSLFIAGRSVEYIPQLIKAVPAETPSFFLNILYWCLPHLDKLNISNQVVYGYSASPIQLSFSLIYSLSYAAILLGLASITFRDRDFN